jgi:hypothetical protein
LAGVGGVLDQIQGVDGRQRLTSVSRAMTGGGGLCWGIALPTRAKPWPHGAGKHQDIVGTSQPLLRQAQVSGLAFACSI